jgi:UDP-N-acetylmuramate--alanine ligase
MYKKIKRIHLIGVGGIGMSGLAELLLGQGYEVSGSDLNLGDTAKSLLNKGVKVLKGHESSHVYGAELVVYSSAIRPENPELVAAKENQIPTILRAEMLAELMRLKYGIAIGGAHGKTTTTSMIGFILVEAGLDPTVVVGGRVDNFGGTNARPGAGEFMVVEADESDGSFNKLSPSIAVVTNMDREHMDYYKTMRRLKKAVLSFLNKVPFYGLCVVCGDDPYLKYLHHQVTRRKKTYGFGKDNNYRIKNYEVTSQGSQSLVQIDDSQVTLTLKVPGRHNALNALAAIVVADELSIPREVTLEALKHFQGVQRRFQKRGEKNGVLFIDDYAHHPTEILATLKAAREQFPQSKIRVLFQPHRYSRVEDLLDQFPKSFSPCDSVAITDIYAAGESALPGISSETLVDLIQRRGLTEARTVRSATEGMTSLIDDSNEGDIILTLGAGDLPNVYRQLF